MRASGTRVGTMPLGSSLTLARAMPVAQATRTHATTTAARIRATIVGGALPILGTHREPVGPIASTRRFTSARKPLATDPSTTR